MPKKIFNLKKPKMPLKLFLNTLKITFAKIQEIFITLLTKIIKVK